MSDNASGTDGFAEDGELAIGSESLQFLEHDPPLPGQALPVAPGVRWCRLPLPMALDHINVWLVDHDDGCVVVDTGLNTSVCRDAWLALERDVLVQTPLAGVMVTHMHPDHLGLAHWLQQRHEVPVWMSRRTHEQAERLLSEDEAERTAAEQFFVRHGLGSAERGPQYSPGRFAGMLSGRPEVARHLDDGALVTWGTQHWQSFEVHGHAEGHVCLHNLERAVLISGDQVLPTISPNIGLNWRSRDPNPLGSYLSSLERLSGLAADTLVLPAHGQPFVGLQARARDLRLHHETQLATIESACAQPKCAAELLPALFRRPLSGVHLLLAISETVAHIEYLVRAGRLRPSGAAGGEIERYRAVT